MAEPQGREAGAWQGGTVSPIVVAVIEKRVRPACILALAALALIGWSLV